MIAGVHTFLGACGGNEDACLCVRVLECGFVHIFACVSVYAQVSVRVCVGACVFVHMFACECVWE